MDDFLAKLEGRRPAEVIDGRVLSIRLKSEYLLAQNTKNIAENNEDWAFAYGAEMAFRTILEAIHDLPIGDRRDEIRNKLNEARKGL